LDGVSIFIVAMVERALRATNKANQFFGLAVRLKAGDSRTNGSRHCGDAGPGSDPWRRSVFRFGISGI
jgi:hypothetical protein